MFRISKVSFGWQRRGSQVGRGAGFLFELTSRTNSYEFRHEFFGNPRIVLANYRGRPVSASMVGKLVTIAQDVVDVILDGHGPVFVYDNGFEGMFVGVGITGLAVVFGSIIGGGISQSEHLPNPPAELGSAYLAIRRVMKNIPDIIKHSLRDESLFLLPGTEGTEIFRFDFFVLRRRWKPKIRG